jgi:very-long-chain enoyl-CoA reductase
MHFGFAVSILSQLSNYCCHIILRNLGAADENIGSLLSSIACANCTTDIMQWVGFNIATQTMAGFLFLTVEACTTIAWAVQKHRQGYFRLRAPVRVRISVT